MEARSLIGLGLVGVGGLYLYGRWVQSRAGLEYGGGGDYSDFLPEPDPTRAAIQRTQSAGVPAFRAPATGGSPGGSFSSAGLQAATAVGTGALAGAIGPGSIALGAATAGIGAGVALLSWAIVKKGLFRGGEVGVYTNPMRDNFLLQFGPGGWDMTPGQDGWPTSGAPKLAAMLTAITGEPDGSHYFKALMGAESVQNELIPATREIKGVLATKGIYIDSF
jgi:hypothetical protein